MIWTYTHDIILDSLPGIEKGKWTARHNMSLLIDLWPVAPHPPPSTPPTSHTHCASHFLSHQLQLGLFNFHFKVVGCFFYIYFGGRHSGSECDPLGVSVLSAWLFSTKWQQSHKTHGRFSCTHSAGEKFGVKSGAKSRRRWSRWRPCLRPSRLNCWSPVVSFCLSASLYGCAGLSPPIIKLCHIRLVTNKSLTFFSFVFLIFICYFFFRFFFKYRRLSIPS